MTAPHQIAQCGGAPVARGSVTPPEQALPDACAPARHGDVDPNIGALVLERPHRLEQRGMILERDQGRCDDHTKGRPIGRLFGRPEELRVDAADTGVLVEPEDEEGFARALERVLLDAELGNSLGRNAIERTCSGFSLERLVSNIDALYRRLATERSRRSAPRAHVVAVTTTSCVRKTRLVLLFVAGLAVGAAGVSAGARRPREEAVVATLVPLWAVGFGAGLWRGLVLAAAKGLSSFQFETAAEVEDP
jgi:hypothetical protein